jgi:hypothetical protein
MVISGTGSGRDHQDQDDTHYFGSRTESAHHLISSGPGLPLTFRPLLICFQVALLSVERNTRFGCSLYIKHWLVWDNNNDRILASADNPDEMLRQELPFSLFQTPPNSPV